MNCVRIPEDNGACIGTKAAAASKPKPGKVATKEQSDNMFVFITAEMMVNQEDPLVQRAKPAECSLLCMLAGPEALPGQLYMSVGDPAAVIVVALDKFRAGEEWDHKTHIRRYTGDAEYLLLDGDRAIRFDMLSNIHYGYIFAEMGVAEPIAQGAAGAGEVWAPLALITGENDRVDQLAVSIGYEVHSAVPSTPETLRPYNDAMRALLLKNFDVLVSLDGACFVESC